MIKINYSKAVPRFLGGLVAAGTILGLLNANGKLKEQLVKCADSVIKIESKAEVIGPKVDKPEVKK